MPMNPPSVMVRPDEVALNALGEILNLSESELSYPTSHWSIPLSWNCMKGSPPEVLFSMRVEVEIRPSANVVVPPK